jgi:hypothetical protein
MEILRVPPYQTNAVIVVGSPATVYNYTLTDMVDNSVSIGVALSGNDSKVSIELPSKYDNTYLIEIDGEEHFFEVVRPYVDPNTKGKTASEIAEYYKNEELARAIIDSIVEGGFYYRKKISQITGLGADYLPVWDKVQKLLRLTENGLEVFNSEAESTQEITYGLSEDKTAITIFYSGEINKAEGAPNVLPATRSDLLDLVYGYRGFPKGYDYIATLEVGYKTIPSDIVRATELLIEDISCGKLEYYKRYIADYNTDQFKIKFDQSIFGPYGTGNLLVDKILSKYRKDIDMIGVL